MSNTYYHFVSSLRQGLAASIKDPPEAGEKRVGIDVAVHAQRRKIGDSEWDTSVGAVQRKVQLYGPGDVETFDSRIVVRTDPKPNSGNFEPNYFPAVEFAEPDFPWRYTPEAAKAGGSSLPAKAVGLTPWIALVVLVAEDRGDNVRREFTELKQQRNQRPAIRVLDQTDLPNPAYAWRWAHVQATTGTEGLIADQLAALTEEERNALTSDELEAMNAAAIEALFATRPELVVSRLMCPRRLAPKTLYRAFVVPTYKLGWATALGTPEARASVADAKATDLAWNSASSDAVDLPYFFDWEFRTSDRGDFESLVRLLEGRALEGLGLRDMDCERPGFGLTLERPGSDGGASHQLGLEGALQSLDTSYTPWGHDRLGDPPPEPFQTELADRVLNRANVVSRVVVPQGFGEGLLDDFSAYVLPNGRSVRVFWRTASQTVGSLEYGPEDLAGGPTYTNQAPSAPASTQHSVTIDLVPETTYHLRIRVTNAAGTETLASGVTVRVSHVAVPQGFGEGLLDDFSAYVLPNGRSVRVFWRTAGQTVGSLEYGPEDLAGGPTYTNQVPSAPASTQHSVTIDLVPEINYHLRIRVTNAAGTETVASGVTVRVPLPAVLPPIYGRWHAPVRRVEPDRGGWVHVLNLDPRHRAAAGFGSEVVRKQQEALMASAWDQIGAIETANDVLRRAQFGRESSHFLHERLGGMALEDFLRVSGPTHKRVVRPDPDGVRRTVTSELAEHTRIPEAALSPAFRRISRARGRMRKQSPRRMDLLRRLADGTLADGTLAAAGPAPTLPGTLSMCDVSRELLDTSVADLLPQLDFSVSAYELSHTGQLAPDITFEGTIVEITEHNGAIYCSLRLHWSVTTANQLEASAYHAFIASDAWEGAKPVHGDKTLNGILCYVPDSGGGGPTGGLVDGGGLPSVALGWQFPQFSLSCSGDFGVVVATVTLVQNIPPAIGTTGSVRVEERQSGELAPAFARALTVHLQWSSLNATALDAAGPDSWQAAKALSGTETVGPLHCATAVLSWDEDRDEWSIVAWQPHQCLFTFALSGEGTFGNSEVQIAVEVAEDGSVSWTPEDSSHVGIDDVTAAFCMPPDGDLIYAQMPDTPEGIGGSNGEVTNAIKDALEALKPVPPADLPPTRDVAFLKDLRKELHKQLNPHKTIPERTRRRLRLHPRLASLFAEGAAGDVLDEIMAYPDFPQPMYESLRDISQSLILPGVEKVPQNTVSLLVTNGRFLESYMVGLNHEFAGELLWRHYPTDQRGSYFRQFWDVSEYVPQPHEALMAWHTSRGYTSLNGLDRRALVDIIRDNPTAAAEVAPPDLRMRLADGDTSVLHNTKRAVLEVLAAAVILQKELDELDRGTLVNIIRDDLATAAEMAPAHLQTRLVDDDISALDGVERAVLTALAKAVVLHKALAEQLKDIARIHQWGGTELGENDNRKQSGKGESLVLIIRGDLLKRYPNALIYAINGRGSGPEELIPNLAEFDGTGGTPVFPIFRGSLGADLVFLGFPFDETMARSGTNAAGVYNAGVFFVLEERISEARFGLDAIESEEPQLRPWENLWWGNFNLEVGRFLDDSTEKPSDNEESWNSSIDAALRARITLQRPARLVIHADQMLPPKNS